MSLTEEELIANFEEALNAYGASDMLLIVEDQEIPISTAVRENYNDIVSAFEEHVFLDKDYERSLSENIKAFFYVNLRGLSTYDVPSTYNYGGDDLDWRSQMRTPRVMLRLHYIFNLVARYAKLFNDRS